MPNLKQYFTSKDFWSGVMFMATGGVAIGIARDYPLGSSLGMGPGYFPIALGGVLICLGAIITFRGSRHIDRIEWNWDMRALLILPTVVIAFGLLIGRVGLVPSLAVVIVGSAAAFSKFPWYEILLLTLGLVFLLVSIFVWGLGLPHTLFQFRFF
ncbi:hypothetical protein AGMMS50256_06250 [Betaproteobacteria bacterium]|nr:hypothetical protein AGMMS50256_06250 [Betaproteobacteria bacterium]